MNLIIDYCLFNVLFAILFIFVIILVLLYTSNDDKVNRGKSLQVKINETCDNIKKAKDDKLPFLILVHSKEGTSQESLQALSKFKQKYKDVIMYEIPDNYINDKCIQEILLETGNYENGINNNVITLIGSKDGQFNSTYIGFEDIYLLENYFDEAGIIDKIEIKENITYKQYKENIKSDEYIIIVIGDIDYKHTIEENAKKILSDKKYDIVSYRSDIGDKIYNDLNENYEIGNLYPRAFYFKNGKIIADVEVNTEDTFINFKKLIN